jgi:hypothetical protein
MALPFPGAFFVGATTAMMLITLTAAIFSLFSSVLWKIREGAGKTFEETITTKQENQERL